MWFGGKRRVAPLIWQAFGNVDRYIEPFFGGGAVMLGNPSPAKWEIINDRDCYVANFWRASKMDPDGVAEYADWPINQCDLSARHCWLKNQVDFREHMLTDPDYYDAKIAGWWVWGICQWIGRGWCVDGESRKRPFVSNRRGVLSGQRQELNGRMGVLAQDDIRETMARLASRLRNTMVLCGDWSACVGSATVLGKIHSGTAVFLDPPYAHSTGRDPKLYREEMPITAAVGDWCREHGHIRVALCGLEGEYDLPGWTVQHWKSRGGYSTNGGNGEVNSVRERIWFSPACNRVALL